MIDRERETIENMVKAMSVEEKLVAWNVLKDDDALNHVLSQAAKEDPAPPTIERLMKVAAEVVCKKEVK